MAVYALLKSAGALLSLGAVLLKLSLLLIHCFAHSTVKQNKPN